MKGLVPDNGPGHVFISYVREDQERVDRLQRTLESAGIRVWRDTALWPGQDWKIEISRAIRTNSLAFIACFSNNSERRSRSYQNEELILAATEMRLRPPGNEWLIPVRFASCSMPTLDLGAGRTLDSLQRIDLFDGFWKPGIDRLVAAVLRILGTAINAEGQLVREVLKSPAAGDQSDVHKERSATGNAVHDVFISHVPANIDIARRIYAELEHQSYNVWWNNGKVLPGRNLNEALPAIRTCKYFVMVLSSKYVQSTLVSQELSLAKIRAIEQSGVLLISILYEDCPIPAGLESMEFLDFRNSSTTGLRRLVELLDHYEELRRGSALISTDVTARPTLGDEAVELVARIRGVKKLYMATDLGGTRAYVSMMTPDGERLFDRKFSTQSHNDASGLLQFLATCINETAGSVHAATRIPLDEIRAKIGAYGVAFAGPTDSHSGIVRDASNFQIRNYPLARELTALLGKPVFVGNDANLGVIGEAWKGAAKGHRNVIGIVIGTGIGGGIVIEGKLYQGSSSAAGEIGHMVIDINSEVTCGCGQNGCFEALASRKAIALEVCRRKELKNISDPRWDENNLGSAELADYVAAGDIDVVGAVQDALKIWGKGVFTLLNVLNPDMVFFGGGFVRALHERLGDSFLDPVKEEAARCMNSIYESGDWTLPIVSGKLDNPMLSGACWLAINGDIENNEGLTL